MKSDMTTVPPPREDLAAILATQQEIGREYDPELHQAFLDRVERDVEARVNAKLVDMERRRQSGSSGRYSLRVLSLVFGIPLSGIATSWHGAEGLVALGVVWGGIAAVNVADSLGMRRRRP